MNEIYKAQHFDTFEDAMHSHPVVHAYMVMYMRDRTNYIETLKKIIVHLANQNEEIAHQLACEIAGKPSPNLFIDQRLRE